MIGPNHVLTSANNVIDYTSGELASKILFSPHCEIEESVRAFSVKCVFIQKCSF